VWSAGLVASVLVLGACASPSPERAQATRSVVSEDTPLTPDGLARIKDVRGGAVLYVKPEHQIGRYSKFGVAPVSISYAPHSPRFTPDQELRLATSIREIVMEAVREGGLEVVERPDPCALWADVDIRELELAEGSGFVGSKSTYARSLGTVAVTMKLLDSMTNELLLIYATRRSLPGGQYVEMSRPNWRTLENVFSQVVRDLGAETARAVPATQSGELDTTCRDPIRDRVP
jgi:hypothetical protein